MQIWKDGSIPEVFPIMNKECRWRDRYNRELKNSVFIFLLYFCTKVLFSFEWAICSPGVSCQLILIDARTLFWNVLKAFRDKAFTHSSGLMFWEKGLNPKYFQFFCNTEWSQVESTIKLVYKDSESEKLHHLECCRGSRTWQLKNLTSSCLTAGVMHGPWKILTPSMHVWAR